MIDYYYFYLCGAVLPSSWTSDLSPEQQAHVRTAAFSDKTVLDRHFFCTYTASSSVSGYSLGR